MPISKPTSTLPPYCPGEGRKMRVVLGKSAEDRRQAYRMRVDMNYTPALMACMHAGVGVGACCDRSITFFYPDTFRLTELRN